MKKWPRTLLILGVTSALLALAAWGYYSYKYPYGYSHRCCKVLVFHLLNYADEHDGKFPHSDKSDALGLSALINHSPETLELVVGKAGDFEAAEAFYRDHGFLRPEHSSWNYASGLTTTDKDKALLWDKIPLGHNGERTDRNTREVIMVDGSVKQIEEPEWEEFKRLHTTTP